MIEGEVSPHKGDRNTELVITYLLNETIIDDARVKVYLNEYDPVKNGFDYTIDKTLFDYFEVDPANISPIKIKLSDEQSGFYRVGLKLAHNGKYYSDCDSANQFLLVDDSAIITNLIAEPTPDIKLSVEALRTVYLDELFLINVTVFNDGLKEVNGWLYSYVNNGSIKVSEGSWTANKQELFLSPGASINTTISNTVTSLGNFTLAVRFNHGDKTTVRRVIEVVNKPTNKLFLNSKLLNDSLRLTVSNPDYQEKNISLFVYSEFFDLKKNFLIKPRHFINEYLNLSSLSGKVNVLLFNNGLLVAEQSVLVNHSSSLVNKPSSLVNHSSSLVNHSVPFLDQVLVKNNTFSDNSLITGSFVAGGFGMEILLYPLIVIICLIGVGWLLWKN